MNERSSRSHAAFMLSLLQKSSHGNGARLSQLFLVDLAGSERVKKSRVEGEGMDQAVAINKSLHALGKNSLFLLPHLCGRQLSTGLHRQRHSGAIVDAAGSTRPLQGQQAHPHPPR
jgi:hypothetical protein